MVTSVKIIPINVDDEVYDDDQDQLRRELIIRLSSDCSKVVCLISNSINQMMMMIMIIAMNCL